jgi:2'-5' RNA ligase
VTAGHRLFLGVPVSPRTLDALAGAAETLARRAGNARVRPRWVPPANYHVTLKYLGWCRPEAVGAVIDTAAACAAAAEPLKFETARLGAFRAVTEASVVWAGVAEQGARLAALAGALDAAFEPLGFAREARRFHPHVTLARLPVPADLAEVLLPLAEQMFSETRAAEVTVYESIVKSSGSEYRAVARVPLGGAENGSKRQTPGLQRAPGEHHGDQGNGRTSTRPRGS